MKKTVITMEYDENFESELLKIRTELKDFLEKNLKKLKNIDRNKLIDLTHRFIFDKVEKDFGINFGINELRKPEEFILFCIKIMDFCLDYGFIILNTMAKLEQYQNFKVFAIKINNKIIDA